MARASAQLAEDYVPRKFPAGVRTGGGGSDSGGRRFVLTLSEESAVAFFEMEEVTDADSDSEVVRNALRLHAYLLRQHQAGAKIFIRFMEDETPTEVSLFVEVPTDAG